MSKDEIRNQLKKTELRFSDAKEIKNQLEKQFLNWIERAELSGWGTANIVSRKLEEALRNIYKEIHGLEQRKLELKDQLLSFEKERSN